MLPSTSASESLPRSHSSLSSASTSNSVDTSPLAGFDFSAPLQALDQPARPPSHSATSSNASSIASPSASNSATDTGGESTEDLGIIGLDEPSNGGFACPTCGHRFRRKNGLSRHMRSHTGEKPFACKLCKFRSTRTDSLQRHMKLHAHAQTHGPLAHHYHTSHPYDAHLLGGSRLHNGHHRPYSYAARAPLPMPGYGYDYPGYNEFMGPPEPIGLGVGMLDPQPGSSLAPMGLMPYHSSSASATSSASGASSAFSDSPHSLGPPRHSDMLEGSWASPVPSVSGPSLQGPSPSPLVSQQSFSSFEPPNNSGFLAQTPAPSAPPPAPSHHRAVWHAQQQDKGTSPLIIPPPTDTSSAFSNSTNPGIIPQVHVTEGFPSSPEFDFGRLFGSTLADESALGFDAYIAQAASIFSPIKPAGMQDQQQGSLNALLSGDLSDPSLGGSSFASHLTLPLDTSEAPAPAAIPASNRHLSQFVLNFNRHLPFIHAPTIPQLFTDILDHSGQVKMSNEAKQIDCLKPCTEDVLRAMAIVGASYDGMARSDQGFVPVPGSLSEGSPDVPDATPLTVDWYGASELKNKLLSDFADNPPSTVRATFAPVGGDDSLFKDFLNEPTLLRRAQALMLLQFVSLFSQSRAHQNHARLLHGALITIGRELLTETVQRQVLERKLTSQAHLNDYERWRQWSRHMERKRTIWAIAVCDQLQSVLFRLPSFLQPTELDSVDLADLGSPAEWHAPSAADWLAVRKATTNASNTTDSKPPPIKPVSIQSLLRLLLDTPSEEGAAQLSSLGPCGYFVSALCLMSQATETLRTDTQSRKQLRESAGLGPDPPGTTESSAYHAARTALSGLGAGEKTALVQEAQEIDTRLARDLTRLELGLARWRTHARALVPHPGAGAAPWVDESVSVSCATVNLLAQLRGRCQPENAWVNDESLVRLLASCPSSTLTTPDETEHLLVKVRRALRSADPATALAPLGVGVPQRHALAPPMVGGVPEPAVNPSSFRGFFPRLQ